jgi:hypothetical protein
LGGAIFGALLLYRDNWIEIEGGVREDEWKQANDKRMGADETQIYSDQRDDLVG